MTDVVRQPGSGALGRLSGQNRSTVLSKLWRQSLPLASGLWAWLSWDFERLGVSFAHGAASSWAPRFFSECSQNAWTALWEVALIVMLTVMIVGKELQRR